MQEFMQTSVKFCLNIGLSLNIILLASISKLSRRLGGRVLIISYSLADVDT